MSGLFDDLSWCAPRDPYSQSTRVQANAQRELSVFGTRHGGEQNSKTIRNWMNDELTSLC